MQNKKIRMTFAIKLPYREARNLDWLHNRWTIMTARDQTHLNKVYCTCKSSRRLSTTYLFAHPLMLCKQALFHILYFTCFILRDNLFPYVSYQIWFCKVIRRSARVFREIFSRCHNISLVRSINQSSLKWVWEKFKKHLFINLKGNKNISYIICQRVNNK